MSSISGNCSDSPANVLFQKGIEASQERQRLESVQEKNSIELKSSALDSPNPAIEGVKGSLFDAYA